jgi:hypothetical protein
MSHALIEHPQESLVIAPVSGLICCWPARLLETWAMGLFMAMLI